jgi:DNA-binding ferritin-like protein
MLEAYGFAPAAEIAVVLSAIQALQHVHHTNHWQTRDRAFYGDHLLFQRLYEDIIDEIDTLAEKAVGLGGHTLVQPLLNKTHELMFVRDMYAECATKQVAAEEMSYISLRAEQGFTTLLQDAYKRMEASGTLSLGADNLLQGIADKHEEHLYLLQQRDGGKMAALVARVAQRVRG